MKRLLFLLLAVLCLNAAVFSEAEQTASPAGAAYPHIESLLSRKSNFILQQYLDEVQAAGKAIKTGREPFVNFYTYTAEKGDTLMRLYARCSVPYESIASLNRLQNKDVPLEGMDLILPTVAGLYIPKNPESEIELLLASCYSVRINSEECPVYHIGGEEFYFLAGERYTPEVRAFFLNPGMSLPLESYRLTSPFGMRVSPISGQWKFHRGIDMTAAPGTVVMACRAGTVKNIGRNDFVYGNYVILRHEDGMTSLYAHLSYIYDLAEGETVLRRQPIGKVGQTGLATGPHLHFEIKVNGEAQDPEKYIKG